jgi:hypothetical protein
MSGHLMILQAIALKKCVLATYNGVRMKLAPHILYTRHEEMFLDAVALLKHGEPPREKKLGTFKIVGMNNMELTEEAFEVEEFYEPEAEKYDDVKLFEVER